MSTFYYSKVWKAILCSRTIIEWIIQDQRRQNWVSFKRVIFGLGICQEHSISVVVWPTQAFNCVEWAWPRWGYALLWICVPLNLFNSGHIIRLYLKQPATGPWLFSTSLSNRKLRPECNRLPSKMKHQQQWQQTQRHKDKVLSRK